MVKQSVIGGIIGEVTRAARRHRSPTTRACFRGGFDWGLPVRRAVLVLATSMRGATRGGRFRQGREHDPADAGAVRRTHPAAEGPRGRAGQPPPRRDGVQQALACSLPFIDVLSFHAAAILAGFPLRAPCLCHTRK
eukprot:COSAG01_NODE_1636_length_9660_cov_10.575881_9_plen_136_part_00